MSMRKRKPKYELSDEPVTNGVLKKLLRCRAGTVIHRGCGIPLFVVRVEIENAILQQPG